MTHIFLATEGFPDGIEHFLDSIRKNCMYTLKEGADYEVGNKAGVTVREVRLWDITVKQDTKTQFLGEIKKYVKIMSEGNIEKSRTIDKGKHGVDGTGFKIGLFRKMLNYVLKKLNLAVIDMSQISNVDNKGLDEAMTKQAMHGYAMVLGELPDFFQETGRNAGREHS